MRFVRHHPLAMGQLMVFAVLVACAQYCFSTRVDPAQVSQARWYQMALGEHEPHAVLPKKRVVVFEQPDEGPWQVVLSYLPPPLGEGGKPEVQGRFDLKTGQIQICGKLTVLQAGLPEKLQPTFKGTLRHEYGHALMADWMKLQKHPPEKEPYIWLRQPETALDPQAYPKELQTVVAEYMAAPRTIYVLPHFTSSFDEYIAQSYARLVSGKEVPPHTEGFLTSAISAE